MGNRGKNPSTKTIRQLIANSGGRCQFEGCNKKVFVEELTKKKNTGFNIAHIVGSSSDGPRGNENSELLSNDINNLMLLCPEHHTLIDSHKDEYTVEILQKMKLNQEKMVSDLLDSMYYPKSEMIFLSSPIKGSQMVQFSIQEAIEALRKSGKNPASEEGIPLRISSDYDYSTQQYWLDVDKKLNRLYQERITYRLDNNPNLKVSVFPLAPIPLIIKLGYLLGDKNSIEIFQKFRSPNTWWWLSDDKTNDFYFDKQGRYQGGKIAIVVSLTAKIDLDRVKDVYDADVVYHIYSTRNGFDCVSSREDLKSFSDVFIAVCDSIKNCNEGNEIALFPAIPTSAAFEIGRRYMRGVFPKITIYDENDGFKPSLMIGGN